MQQRQAMGGLWDDIKSVYNAAEGAYKAVTKPKPAPTPMWVWVALGYLLLAGRRK